MEALSREFRTGCPCELLYADDLVLIADTLPELKMKLSSWKEAIKIKGLRINMSKTKILISDHDLVAKSDPVKWPCGVCRKGVGKNSIFCVGFKHWVHKRCSGIKRRLVDDPSYKCSVCLGTNNVVTHIPLKIVVCDEELEVVDSFPYLGDSIGQTGGCFDATTDRIRSAWKAFHSLLPVLTNSGIAFKVRGHAYMACVRSVLLYASETWALKIEDVNHIKRNDNMMICWICSSKLADKIPMLNLRSSWVYTALMTLSDIIVCVGMVISNVWIMIDGVTRSWITTLLALIHVVAQRKDGLITLNMTCLLSISTKAML